MFTPREPVEVPEAAEVKGTVTRSMPKAMIMTSSKLHRYLGFTRFPPNFLSFLKSYFSSYVLTNLIGSAYIDYDKEAELTLAEAKGKAVVTPNQWDKPCGWGLTDNVGGSILDTVVILGN
jgi:hypothetical protein